MATALTFTSAPFAQNTSFGTGATTDATILTADASYPRRIYGIVFTNSATQTPTLTIKVIDGSSNVGAVFTLAVTTGANVQTDVFGNSAAAALFQKQKDSNGAPYYNLPANWVIKASISANSTASAYIHVFGETYA